jgi:type I restriction enzyme M protein
MHWIAPSEKDVATGTLEKRLWDTAEHFRNQSRAEHYKQPPFNV